MAYAESSGSMKVRKGNRTLAQVNAGSIIVPARKGKSIMVMGGHLVARGGAAGACTSVDFKDTNGTPVVAIAFGQAGLTENTVLADNAASNVTLTTVETPLTADKALQLVKTGSSMTTATSIDFLVKYVYI